MGDVHLTIESSIEEIESEFKRMHQLIKTMVRQYSKINRFLEHQEDVLDRSRHN